MYLEEILGEEGAGNSVPCRGFGQRPKRPLERREQYAVYRVDEADADAGPVLFFPVPSSFLRKPPFWRLSFCTDGRLTDGRRKCIIYKDIHIIFISYST